jgi:probable phosphomutase (TIGR03848 family)
MGARMTHVILVRHAHSTANARHVLSGRIAGVHLSESGKIQARSLSKRLGTSTIKTLRSSPLERCEETIAPWLQRNARLGTNTKLRVLYDEGLLEADYGLWSGRSLKSLSKEPLWKKVQSRPSTVTFPDGEAMVSMQKRAMKSVENALLSRGRGNVILVSHGDVIKAIVAASLSLDLDHFQRIVVDPASISIIDYSSSTPRLILLNDSRSMIESSSLGSRSKGALVGGGSGPKARKGMV